MKESVHYSDFSGRTPQSHEDWYATANKKVKTILQREYPEEDNRVVAERLKAVEAQLKADDRTWRSGGEDWWQTYVQNLL